MKREERDRQKKQGIKPERYNKNRLTSKKQSDKRKRQTNQKRDRVTRDRDIQTKERQGDKR